MRIGSLMRAVAFAGLAAASAALAHGDARDPRWLGAALCGAALATAVLAAAGSLAARRLPAHTAAPLGLLTAAMLAAQAVAHVAMLAAGAPSHAGLAGGLALHVVLAVLAALLVRGVDLRIESASAASGRTPTLAPSTRRELLSRLEPPAATVAGISLGRAPPKPD
jgi:4-amino-4-deoxy-L-arabinose transferase-like glycosyltransferase